MKRAATPPRRRCITAARDHRDDLPEARDWRKDSDADNLQRAPKHVSSRGFRTDLALLTLHLDREVDADVRPQAPDEDWEGRAQLDLAQHTGTIFLTEDGVAGFQTVETHPDHAAAASRPPSSTQRGGTR